MSGYTEEYQGRSWSSEDGMASEIEVQAFMAGLVRMMKPQTVVETGCYLGGMTEAIAHVLVANNFGRLFTCDINPLMVEATIKRIEQQGLSRVAAWHCRGDELPSRFESTVDLAFLDGGDRYIEALLLMPKLMKHSVIVIHDTKRVAEMKIVDQIEHMDGHIIQFDTPRGLTMIQMRRL